MQELVPLAGITKYMGRHIEQYCSTSAAILVDTEPGVSL